MLSQGVSQQIFPFPQTWSLRVGADAVKGNWDASTSDLMASAANPQERALLHAIAIQDIVERVPMGHANTTHVPASMFAAATGFTDSY